MATPTMIQLSTTAEVEATPAATETLITAFRTIMDALVAYRDNMGYTKLSGDYNIGPVNIYVSIDKDGEQYLSLRDRSNVKR